LSESETEIRGIRRVSGEVLRLGKTKLLTTYFSVVVSYCQI